MCLLIHMYVCICEYLTLQVFMTVENNENLILLSCAGTVIKNSRLICRLAVVTHKSNNGC